MADFNDWSISSSTDTELSGVTPGGSPGEYIFIPPNDREKNIYTIMYSHNGVTGKTEYIVSSADCYTDECATDLIPPTVCFDPTQEQYDEQDSCIAMTVSHEPGNAKTIFTLGKCWKFIGTSYPNQISNVETNPEEGESTIHYKQNSEERNIESVVTYKFKNETANVTGQSDVTIIQEPNPCITATCANAPTLSKNPTTKVPSTGDTVTISYSSLGECWRVDSKKIREGYEQYATLDDNNVVHVNPNTGSTADTSIMVDYVFVNKATNYPCPKEIEIIQEEGCNCSNVDYVEAVTAFTHEGGTAVIGNLATCRRDLTDIVVEDGGEYISSGPSIAQEPQGGVYPVSITVKSNETRDTTYHVKYVINFDDQQCKPGESETPPYYDLIIEPKGCTCTCSQIHRTETDKSYYYDRGEHQGVLLKILGLDKGFSCNFDNDIDVYPIDSGVSELRKVINGSIMINGVEYDQLEIYGNLSETDDKRATRFGISVCGTECAAINPFYVYQRCFCGMDNCTNEYVLPGGQLVYEYHPLYIPGCTVGESSSAEYTCGSGHSQGDAICVENLKCKYRNQDGTYTTVWVMDKLENRGDYPSDEVGVYGNYIYNKKLSDEASTPTYTYSTSGQPLRLRIMYGSSEGLDPIHMSMVYTNVICADANEKQWDVEYTTTAEKVLIGPEANKDACEEFKVRIYQAPIHKAYDSNRRDSNNKQALRNCTNDPQN